MQPVQIVLTDELAGLLAASAQITLKAHEADQIVSLTEDEQTEYKRLAVFMAAVASEPEKFPLRESLARSLKTKVRAAKGEAQPKSRSGRKAKRSQGQQKRDRAARKVEVANFNRAREAYERDRIDHEAYLAERQAQMETEPKFDIVDIAGNVVLRDVPQSLLTPAEPEFKSMADAAAKGAIILPPGVEE